MRYALPCSILACAALSGCANPTGELEARMIELEFRMNTLEARLDVLAPYADRVEALETALSLPGEDDQLLARLLDLEARLVELERARDDAPADEAAPDDRGRVIQMGPAPPGVERIAPKPDLPVRVVATGSGGLLLVEDRDTGQLVRVELLGIHPPLRENEYADYPGLREQFLDALGAARVDTDAPFEASQQHLEDLLADAVVTLSYGSDGARRTPRGAVAAYVRAERGGVGVDVNAAMIRDGYAIAAPRHPRYKDYAALERDARAAQRGLFEPE